MKKDRIRKQSHNPDDFQNATFPNATADLMFCLHWCLLLCLSTINVLFSQAKGNLVYHFYFKTFPHLCSFTSLFLMLFFFGCITETIYNNVSALHLYLAPLGSLFCYSWFKNRLIIQKPRQYCVYQITAQMKSQLCSHFPSHLIDKDS